MLLLCPWLREFPIFSINIENLLDRANDVAMPFKQRTVTFCLSSTSSQHIGLKSVLGRREVLSINVQLKKTVFGKYWRVSDKPLEEGLEQLPCTNVFVLLQYISPIVFPRNISQKYLILAASHPSCLVIFCCALVKCTEYTSS